MCKLPRKRALPRAYEIISFRQNMTTILAILLERKTLEKFIKKQG